MRVRTMLHAAKISWITPETTLKNLENTEAHYYGLLLSPVGY